MKIINILLLAVGAILTSCCIFGDCSAQSIERTDAFHSSKVALQKVQPTKQTLAGTAVKGVTLIKPIQSAFTKSTAINKIQSAATTSVSGSTAKQNVAVVKSPNAFTVTPSQQ